MINFPRFIEPPVFRPARGRTAMLVAALALSMAPVSGAIAHGDVQPQAVDTSGLPELGAEWVDTNPFRGEDGEFHARAVEVGSSAYNQNCARCHGLEAISGGIAPDLRLLEEDYDGDSWYQERVRNGAVRDGRVYMPPFEGIINQEGLWAIRTYIDSRPDD
jgi:cytochrome c-550 PedF